MQTLTKKQLIELIQEKDKQIEESVTTLFKAGQIIAELKKKNVTLSGALEELLECDYTSGTHLYCAQIRARKALEN